MLKLLFALLVALPVIALAASMSDGFASVPAYDSDGSGELIDKISAISTELDCRNLCRSNVDCMQYLYDFRGSECKLARGIEAIYGTDSPHNDDTNRNHYLYDFGMVASSCSDPSLAKTNFYVIYDVFPGDFDVYDNCLFFTDITNPSILPERRRRRRNVDVALRRLQAVAHAGA